MTFLIADDNARMRDSVIRFLSRNLPNHHTFFEAGNGEEAVALFDRHLPDWVLMDVEMEPMDGLTALKRIRNVHPAAKIIVLTAYDETIYRTAAKETGARGYVIKNHLDQIEEIISMKETGPDERRNGY